MAKGTYMNNNTAELKALAKALGKSLASAGHAVPHTALLNAMASAANKRSWNILRATPSARPNPSTSTKPLVAAEVLPEYTAGTWFLLQLAYCLGHGIPPSDTVTEPSVRNWALSRVGGELAGVLAWSGWSVPASLDMKTCTLDAGDFTPEGSGVQQASFTVRMPAGEPFHFRAVHSRGTGWILDNLATASAIADMEKRIPQATLRELGVGQPPVAVPALVRTDDDTHAVNFDAVGFLKQASAEQIAAILADDGKDGEATDAVVDWEQSHGKASGALTEMHEYLVALQKSPACEVGFSCSVEVPAMLAWLAEHRQATLALALCDYFDVFLEECDEPELEGRWDWFSATDSSSQSYESPEDAAVAAMSEKQLLQKIRMQFA